VNHPGPARRSPGPGGRGQPQQVGPWHAARPELIVVSVALVACAVAAYAVAGGPAAVLVVVVFAAVALGVLSLLLPPSQGGPARPEAPETRPTPATSFINYWRVRRGLTDAMSSTAAYRAGLGTNLEHVLAARLSEHHGVSLYGQPEVARGIFCANPKDADLWPWVDPARLREGGADGRGIPPKTLARLVQRLEQL
jgi:hypothetical protein